MASPTTQASPFAQALQDEALKNAQRWSNWAEAFVVNPADPPMGMTPKEVVWKRGKICLYRYPAQTVPVKPVPYFIVPWLGISRPYVLDMMPGHSMVEFLVQHGYEVYMLDWGIIAEEDKDLGFEELVYKIVPRAIDRILETSQAQEITLNGLCLGGVITSSYLGLNPDAPVKNVVAIVTPIDFDQGGLFKTWLGNDYFPVDLMVQRFGGVPPSLMGMGFKMLRPTNDVAALSGLWFNMDRQDYITIYKAMNKWANDYVGMPGRFFSQLTQELYFKNQLLKGEFTIRGRRVDLRHIHQPLLVVAASQDNIVPPLAAKGLMDAVSSQDKEYVELRGGHISVFSGRQAHKVMWPKLDAWLTQRGA
jgi:polyhydroxyalkanoate synthase subunit PhaC